MSADLILANVHVVSRPGMTFFFGVLRQRTNKDSHCIAYIATKN